MDIYNSDTVSNWYIDMHSTPVVNSGGGSRWHPPSVSESIKMSSQKFIYYMFNNVLGLQILPLPSTLYLFLPDIFFKSNTVVHLLYK